AHPIDTLIRAAREDFSAALDTRATSLQDAAEKYRRKRGRHPPPGFDAWYSFAASRDSMVIESFFDQIHDDLAPFWGMDPRTLRRQAHSLMPRIVLRQGRVQPQMNHADESGQLQVWQALLGDLANLTGVKLPDVDMPTNTNFEPAVLVPWELIDTFLELSRPRLVATAEVLGKYSGLRDLDANARITRPASYLGPRPFWSLVIPACRPDSPTTLGRVFNDIWQPDGHTSEEHSAAGLLASAATISESGFVENWTSATDLCKRPVLQGLHGSLVFPDTFSLSKKLFPYFGKRKFAVNNDILLPGAGEWNFGKENGSVAVPWEEKADKLFWRGAASGGKNTKLNWQRFLRHRFVSMTNDSHVAFAESSLQNSSNGGLFGVGPAQTFRLSSTNAYNLLEQEKGRLSEWVRSWADVRFTDLVCDDNDDKKLQVDASRCPYDEEFFSTANGTDLKEQGKYKYTAILDGNGRDDDTEFLDALRKPVVPIRASLYRRWFDSRLGPWVHYVPVDTTLVDLYGVMHYFLGENAKALSGRREPQIQAHDEQARRIALGGKEWAERVLRKEDMLVYVYRLLLEYARVVDDRRERLGWVGDM
ncbi:hypothetical protein BCR34DRAFT_436121, partial [Clohesyomyces aquaticus]